jgi:hypothetical protein
MPIEVVYKGLPVGEGRLDFLVGRCSVVELKAVKWTRLDSQGASDVLLESDETAARPSHQLQRPDLERRIAASRPLLNSLSSCSSLGDPGVLAVQFFSSI